MKRWRLLEKKRKQQELINRVMLKVILSKVDRLELKSNNKVW